MSHQKHSINTGAVRALASRLNMASDGLRRQAGFFSDEALQLHGLFHYGDEEEKKKIEELFKEMQSLRKSTSELSEKVKGVSDQLFAMAQEPVTA